MGGDKKKTMRVLVTGGSSLLGKNLLHTKPEKVELYSTWFTNHIQNSIQLDVGNKSQIAYVFEKIKPEIVIHCAAVGSVDYTESHFLETHAVNVLGTENILKAFENCIFVYISTNAVFDGTSPPYSENSECHPINRYGSIKREAEIRVMNSRNWIIIRPFLLYGFPYPNGRQNWMTTIINKLSQGKEVRLVDDTYWQPTLAEDCALAIWKLLNRTEEIYHVASDDRMTLFEFGLKVARIWGYDLSLVQPIASSSLKIAPRPKDTTFNLTKIHDLGIKLRGVEEGLSHLERKQSKLNHPKFI